MSKKTIDVFMFIDAMGWEVIKDKNFLEDVLPHRYRVKMQFGYSSTAIPTILSGKKPTEHGHLGFFYYNPEKSPFKMLKFFRFLPKVIFSNWRVRVKLSKLIAKLKGFTGYFELYSVPFERLPYFDYSERYDIYAANGLAPVKNIKDELLERNIPHHISNWRLSEDANFQAVSDDVKRGEIRFAFLYTAAMDGLLHKVTKDGKEIPEKLKWYSEKIKKLIDEIKENYDDFTFHVMSDHGMTTLTEGVDIQGTVESVPFKWGKDYIDMHDSTMGRYWFFNDDAKKAILEKLENAPHGHLLTREEKVKYGIDFEDNKYGEEIFLMDAGYQIEPCDLGRKALPGMHGFAPEDKDSFASFLSTEKMDPKPQWVGDYHTAMLEKMEKIKNQ